MINAALARGQDLILTPGVYRLRQAIEITRPDTVVLGLGFPTLVPENGTAGMRVAASRGCRLAGMIFDAGPGAVPGAAAGRQPPPGRARPDPADPTVLQDVFFRIGGSVSGPGRPPACVVDSSQVILDDIWAWRADHGDGVGWTEQRREHRSDRQRRTT